MIITEKVQVSECFIHRIQNPTFRHFGGCCITSNGIIIITLVTNLINGCLQRTDFETTGM